MSKRFGRNQKRKLREQLKAVTFDLGRYKYQSFSLKEQLDRYKHQYQELTDLIRQWWDYSVLLEPEQAFVKHLPPEYRVPIKYPSQTLRFYDNAPVPMEETVMFHYNAMHAVKMAMEHSVGSRASHIILRVNNKEVAYYLDDNALNFLREPPSQIAKMLTETILGYLIKQTRKDER